MRTTLNLDDDVSAQVGAIARREARSLSRVVNDLLRTGLRSEQESTGPSPYDPPIVDTGRHLVDVTDVAAALEALERDA